MNELQRRMEVGKEEHSNTRNRQTASETTVWQLTAAQERLEEEIRMLREQNTNLQAELAAAGHSPASSLNGQFEIGRGRGRGRAQTSTPNYSLTPFHVPLAPSPSVPPGRETGITQGWSRS